MNRKTCGGVGIGVKIFKAVIVNDFKKGLKAMKKRSHPVDIKGDPAEVFPGRFFQFARPGIIEIGKGGNQGADKSQYDH